MLQNILLFYSIDIAYVEKALKTTSAIRTGRIILVLMSLWYTEAQHNNSHSTPVIALGDIICATVKEVF